MADDLRREAISTVSLLLSAFEQVQHEAPWFEKAFEKGKAFLDKWKAAELPADDRRQDEEQEIGS